MEIAIIGAGVSGLSCAYELVKNGIMPVIFEKNRFLGHQLEYSSLWPRYHSNSNIDCIKYLKDTFDLEFTPMEEIRVIESVSKERKMIDNGELGYIFRRGKESHSLEKQLASKFNAQIVLDGFIKIEDIKDSFDKIIVATGNNLIAKQYHLWNENYISQVRVSTVLGSFDTGIIKVWPQKDYSNNAFCYLVPNNPKEASLIMIVKGITHHELYYCWDSFLKEEGISYCITEVRDAEVYCGKVSSFQNHQIYFIGSAGCFKDKFIGAGEIDAILSGINTAKSIVSLFLKD